MLILIAIPLYIVFGTIGLIYGVCRNLFGLFDKLNVQAYQIDLMGNVIATELFNDLLITKSSNYKFGNPLETISFVLGKNKQNNTLRFFGKYLVEILNNLDPFHVEKAMGLDVSYKLTKLQRVGMLIQALFMIIGLFLFLYVLVLLLKFALWNIFSI